MLNIILKIEKKENGDVMLTNLIFNKQWQKVIME